MAEINDIGGVTLFERSQQVSVSTSEKREGVRSRIALTFVWAFFTVIAAGFAIGFYDNFKVDEYKDMLVAISGVLSGPLGFIIGFYFKDGNDIRN